MIVYTLYFNAMEKYNYKIIYAIVKEDILKGVYPTGTLMPTELTLAEK